MERETMDTGDIAEAELAERLRSVLHYDECTGKFTWRVDRHCGRGRVRVQAGTIAGSMIQGYVFIHFNGKQHRAHRLAWLYVHGRWPIGDIDHIDQNKNNNRLANLRDVSRQVNTQNQTAAQSNNLSCGLRGVTRLKNRNLKKPWNARIKAGDKYHSLGYFKTAAEAYAAYLAAKVLMHEGATK